MELGNVNRRQQNRLPVRPLGPPKPRMTPPCRILDISGTGCLVESKIPLGRVASIVPLDLPVPSRTECPIVRAKIVWERVGPDRGGCPCYRYGLSFLEMDGASHLALDLYLDYLKRDHHVNQLDEAWRSVRQPKTRGAPAVLGEESEDAVPSMSEGPVTGPKNSGNAFAR